MTLQIIISYKNVEYNIKRNSNQSQRYNKNRVAVFEGEWASSDVENPQNYLKFLTSSIKNQQKIKGINIFLQIFSVLM